MHFVKENDDYIHKGTHMSAVKEGKSMPKSCQNALML